MTMVDGKIVETKKCIHDNNPTEEIETDGHGKVTGTKIHGCPECKKKGEIQEKKPRTSSTEGLEIAERIQKEAKGSFTG